MIKNTENLFSENANQVNSVNIIPFPAISTIVACLLVVIFVGIVFCRKYTQIWHVSA